ncbi:Dihydrolipoyllysine-residue acetyltransferase component of pyruvate dehydrogenase complex, mitochondrial [Neolecta irregularis DAH-3]|uniref:Acetyltransferase component of pyruvate dehydrogenase complex n=1 Tax=Neolecta irregularis (strain DAH-3) TaxID=1198029 RepID=A0A1U7LGN8_NEOID|nr:Dihydrolipoyllysine-residue acetyltransferase component of pyruvate dehydrogenase complex, mitochondrial [Neolecta irregularis DAH-3]|eukprot:OLL21712.1 Dihydrolipoyllysine-residue acetyltransferase component of pyruvate dehydrogenase complex, mitochondrial [Neolecta irregularis DAH-3]
MPALSPTMTHGGIGSWSKKEGDQIAPGDVLVEIETDKAQMDFEFQDDGYIAKILAETGTKDVPINQPIAVLVDSESDVEAFKNFTVQDAQTAPSQEMEQPRQDTKEENPLQPEPAKTETEEEHPASSEPPSHRIAASPIARKLASEKGIPLKEVIGSGPNGRIIKFDIENYKLKAEAPSSVLSSSSYTDIPLSNMRKTIAKRLTESKQQNPHYYLTLSVSMDKVLKLRESLNSTSNDSYKLSVNDFLVKAASVACKKVPAVNSAWHTDYIRQYSNVDICVAVATPAGLMTPIVKNVETKGLATISSEIKDLGKRARESMLKPDEYQGGTFTISNMGMFDIDQFTAIINPPQAAILAVGSTKPKVVLDDFSEKGFKVEQMMTVTLSCDHRVVDGAVGAVWIKAFKDILENPLHLLL